MNHNEITMDLTQEDIPFNEVTLRVYLADERIYLGATDITNLIAPSYREMLIYQAIKQRRDERDERKLGSHLEQQVLRGM